MGLYEKEQREHKETRKELAAVLRENGVFVDALEHLLERYEGCANKAWGRRRCRSDWRAGTTCVYCVVERALEGIYHE